MEIIGDFIGGIIAFWINSMLAGAASNIAADKGYSQRRWFHACFWLPVVTYVLVAALPDMELRRQNEEMIALQKQLLVAITGDNRVPSVADDTDDTDVPDPFTK